MENMMIPVVVIFLVLIAAFGTKNVFKFLPILIILGLVYFVGWFVIKYFWPIAFIWFLYSITKKKKVSSSYYNGNRRKTYYSNMNQEQAEEFFRQFMGGAGGFNQNNYGGYSNGYGNQNGYQGNNQYGSFYQEDKTKYYKILGVDKSATPDELKKAYFKLVKEHHPDRFTNSSESEKKYHEDKMKQINEAYDKLTKN